MNHGGDAAEQIVRMTLEGVEVAARVTGTAAKEAVLLLLAALKNDDKDHTKLRGKERLNTMLKSGKPLEIFSVKESDLQTFSQAAKQYGIVYCVLRDTNNSPDGMCDVLVKADDAPKISHIIERFHFATVDKAKIESEIVAEMSERTAGAETALGAELEIPDTNDLDKLIDDLMGTSEGRAEPGKDTSDSRPLADGGRPPKNRQSEPTSENRRNSARGIFSKPSVKGDLREITAAKKTKEAEALRRDGPPVADKPKRQIETTHTQPQRGKKSKSKSKGTR